MEQLRALSLGRKVILGAGILLLIVTFLNWQQIDTPFGSAGQSAWHGFWGVLIGLLTLALVAAMIALVFGVQPPQGIPQGLIALVVAGVVLLFTLIKILADDFVHWPAYVGIVLAAVMTYGAWLNFQDSGESLPSMPKAATAGAGAGGTAAVAESAPPPAVEPAPTPPPEAEPAPPPVEGGETTT
jgi:hypothetical protein